MTNSEIDGKTLAKICIVGGAGFIGSHFVRRLLADNSTEAVRVYDNFSSGRHWHLEPFANDHRFDVVEGNVEDLDLLARSVADFDTIIHLASNPDIARAATEPAVDFDQGTYLTHNVVEAARLADNDIRILYASGSGVYGDIGDFEAPENYGPLIPVSTYGASKLAGEALIASYSYMFGISGCAFRFGNVVGPHQTHGVGYDFARRLLQNPLELRILGDGTQSKSYVHVDDVISAVLLAGRNAPLPFSVFNVATLDYPTVLDIARIAAEVVGVDFDSIDLQFTGGDRGWKGDVPIVRLDTSAIRALGWSNNLTSAEALRSSIASMVEDAQNGLFDNDNL
jgi:UDP-glucose 4-epimerase